MDVVLALLERAGDFCGEDIWHRVVQLVTNNEASQAYAAGRVVEVLRRGASHEALMCMAGCVLGEYGKLVQVRRLLCRLLCSVPRVGDSAPHVHSLQSDVFVLQTVCCGMYGKPVQVGRLFCSLLY